jgi:hypothetical protein
MKIVVDDYWVMTIYLNTNLRLLESLKVNILYFEVRIKILRLEFRTLRLGTAF